MIQPKALEGLSQAKLIILRLDTFNSSLMNGLKDDKIINKRLCGG